MEMLKQLWAYDQWANNLLFDTFEKQNIAIPASSLRLLSHIVNTQATWLSRILKEKPIVSVWQEHDLMYCRELFLQTSSALEKIVISCVTDQQVDYQNTAQRQFRNTLFDILLHVFNHGTYHRAQIAADMRKNGLEPVNTDYITFVR